MRSTASRPELPSSPRVAVFHGVFHGGLRKTAYQTRTAPPAMGRSALVSETDGCRTDQVTLASEASTVATAGPRRERIQVCQEIRSAPTLRTVKAQFPKKKTAQPKNIRLGKPACFSGMASGVAGGQERRFEG